VKKNNETTRIYYLFRLLKHGRPFPSLTLKETYYIAKAHKLVDEEHFYSYWQDGRSKRRLRDILSAYYPPLEYCHSLKTGFPKLPYYLHIAKVAFNKKGTTNDNR